MGTPWLVTWRDAEGKIKKLTVEGCASEAEAKSYAAELLDEDYFETDFTVLSAVPAKVSA